MTRSSSVVEGAQVHRRRLRSALVENKPYSDIIAPGFASCLLGIDQHILKNTHVSILFQPTPEGVTITVDSARQVAKKAFADWARSKEPRMKNTFLRDSYLALYQLFQASLHQKGKQILNKAHVARLFAETLAKSDPKWKAFMFEIKRHGEIIYDADFEEIAEKMQQLLDKIPKGLRNEIIADGYIPQNIFQ